MKRVIFLSLFAAASVLVNAQKNSKLEAEIRRLEQVVVTGILNKDPAALTQMWAPEFLVNNPRNTVTEGRDSVLLLQKAGMIDYSTFEKVIERMQFQKDIVITMGSEIFVSRNDLPGVKAGQAYKRRFTNVWMYKNGKWQQIARHASMICQ